MNAERSGFMYTSFDKIQDRFGFSMSGSFRCAYKNTRPWILAGLIVLGAVAALTFVNFAYIIVLLMNAPASSAQRFNEIISGGLGEIMHGLNLFGDLASIGFGMVGTAFGIFLFLIALIAFIIMCATLRTGQEYTFKADEKLFTIIYPKKTDKTLAIEYDYILGLKYEEWKFIFAPKCLDVTIQTKEGDFSFRVVHTPMSRANGITETPFNIIRERIGIADADEALLINKGAAKETKQNFFS